jgi:isoquinoline 1-oxidoreductase subunit beta
MQRSAFLASGAALVVAVHVPARALAATGSPNTSGAAKLSPSAWLRIDEHDVVTVVLGKSEMGQGVNTSLPMIIAEELEYPVERMQVVFAPPDPAFHDPNLGGQQTGGSTSVKSTFEPLRTAGARAREMLVAAAAKRWNVAAAECTARNGTVVHAASNRSARYGELVADAAALPVPEKPALKPRERWTVIGKGRKRLDTLAKATGQAQYGIDVRLPGMLVATIARPPSMTGHVVGYDAAAAKKVKGVRAVVPVSSGIAVVADNYWSAQQGKNALNARFAAGPKPPSTPRIAAEARALVKTEGAVGRNDGDAHKAIAGAAKTISATYEAPHLAHTTMEPMNATAHVTRAGVEVWAPTQSQELAQSVIAKIAGVKPERVTLHTTFLGGGFGRRLEIDFIQDAVEVAKAVRVPVKVVWSREDDIQHDFYRPAATTAMSAGLDTHGKIVGMKSTLVCQSIVKRALPPMFKNGLDPLAGFGLADVRYAIPNFHYSYHHQETGIPVGFWRAPYANANAWSTESFIDELAHAAGRDPYAFRQDHLPPGTRARTVLDLAATTAGWSKPLPRGVFRGIAFATWDDSMIATVAEISMNGKTPHVRRLVSAVDVGTIVNPLSLEAQVTSAMLYGLSAALTQKVTFTNGAVDQHNFYDYTVLRQDAVPQMTVVFVPSTEKPSGAGEIGTPSVAPAVTNAIFAATGKRIRALPISEGLA